MICFLISSFQSLSGFQVRCNTSENSRFSPITYGFNPYRVFKFAATLESCLVVTKTIFEFQSLSGFQVRCNPSYHQATAQSSEGFNPYRVFKFAATRGSVGLSFVVTTVSIPIGFSSSLQPAVRGFFPLTDLAVSIPIGFSSSLQLLLRRFV